MSTVGKVYDIIYELILRHPPEDLKSFLETYIKTPENLRGIYLENESFPTPLNTAVSMDKKEHVEILLAFGEDPNWGHKDCDNDIEVFNCENFTPLHTATYCGGMNYEIILLLIKHGANVHLEFFESTPLKKCYEYSEDNDDYRKFIEELDHYIYAVKEPEGCCM